MLASIENSPDRSNETGGPICGLRTTNRGNLDGVRAPYREGVTSILLVRSVVEQRVLGRDAPELYASASSGSRPARVGSRLRSVVEQRVRGRDAPEPTCRPPLALVHVVGR